ncbi:phage tail protein [Pseudonocardia sp. CA-107938]|uniref:phage tail protein n=1 Tax=Pseudonocardia sp. CA-107938 TaxID=3240021 RepID=UPI003D8A1172
MTSSYLDHLPATYAEDEFVGRFLLAFEAVLHGRDGVEGLAQLVGRIAEHLDPRTAPADFLPWLAGWVAFSLRADWDVDTQRGFLAEVVPLYRLRGTAAGLQRMLEIYLRPLDGSSARDDVVILDDPAWPAHFFQVRLTLADADATRLRATQEIARAIIDREKPAHTFYALKIVIPTMRLLSVAKQQAEGGELLLLGRNTWLGSQDGNRKGT